MTSSTNPHGYTREEYAAYLQSPQWQARRATALSAARNRCRACRSVTRLHVHHMSYANFGREPQADLVVLCETCHTEVHQYHSASNLDLRAATRKVIAWIQSGEQAPTAGKTTPVRYSKRTVYANGAFRFACLGRKDRCNMPAMNGTPYCFNHDPQFGPPAPTPGRRPKKKSSKTAQRKQARAKT